MRAIPDRFCVLIFPLQAIDVAGLQKLQIQVCSFAHIVALYEAHPRVRRLSTYVLPWDFSYVRPQFCTYAPADMSTLTQAHGYATHEFEVTEERLGVYLPVRVFHDRY